MAVTTAAAAAGRMGDAQNALRVVLGEQYESTLQPVRKLVKDVAEATDASVLSAGIMLAKEATAAREAMTSLLLICATVDLIQEEERQ